ncbi:short-chain dehydrogenase/reductase [Bombardia bombarda]|uniref:Short-chain dehydrogenase/reductase n=1 Tax=Bombardia bombarda TaxID=252184 RepID=A0AA39XJ51_9PEZI|nr:short-chain dehydrogenase/reductase [Bombardia bombarda]
MADSKKPPSYFSVEGKTAIVTGAGSGINLAFAELLLSRSCNVVFADISLRPEAQAVVDRYSDGSPRALYIQTDVTSWPALTNLIETSISNFGDFDILCPGAGVFEPTWSGFWHPPGADPEARDTPDGGRYATIDIDLTHPIRATQLALGHWLNNKTNTKPRRVLHISSIAAQLPTFPTPLYGAAKAGLSAFVRAMAPLDAEFGVRVNAVAPGLILTPLWVEDPDKQSLVDLKGDTWATPKEVAVAMMRCVEEPELVGGTVLEVGREHSRLVAALGDPGPDRNPESGKALSNSRFVMAFEYTLGYVLVISLCCSERDTVVLQV